MTRLPKETQEELTAELETTGLDRPSDVVLLHAVSHGVMKVKLCPVSSFKATLVLLFLEACSSLSLSMLVKETGHHCQHTDCTEDCSCHHTCESEQTLRLWVT